MIVWLEYVNEDFKVSGCTLFASKVKILIPYQANQTTIMEIKDANKSTAVEIASLLPEFG